MEFADHNGEHYERNRNQTDATIQDASYVALRNLTIGYTVNASWARFEILCCLYQLIVPNGGQLHFFQSRRGRDYKWWLPRTYYLWCSGRSKPGC